MRPLRRLENEIGGTLADHDRGCVGIARWHGRHDGSVSNAEIFNTVNAKLVVDHCHGIVTHLARTHGVVGSLGIGFDPIQQFIV